MNPPFWLFFVVGFVTSAFYLWLGWWGFVPSGVFMVSLTWWLSERAVEKKYGRQP